MGSCNGAIRAALIFTACVAVLSLPAAFAQPATLRRAPLAAPREAQAVAGAANDSCSSPAAVSGFAPFAFNNAASTTDGPAHNACDVFELGQTQVPRDEWFCWTAPATACASGYVVETCGRTHVDSRVAVYSGCGCPTDDSRLLGCRDDECDVQTRVPFQAQAGQSYLIRVGTYPGMAGGAGSLVVRCAEPEPCTQPAANCRVKDRFNALQSDRTAFLTADDFSPATSAAVTSVCWWGAYLDADDLNCQGVSPDSFRVRYFTDDAGLPGALLATFNQGATLTVTGPVATGELIADTAPEYAYTATHAAVNLSAGQRYWIEISNAISGCPWYWETAVPADEQALQDGTVSPPLPPDGYDAGDVIRDDLAFCLSVPLPPPPANDRCGDSTVINGVGEFNFNTSFATTDGPPHEACDFFAEGVTQVAQDTWYCWTSPCTETVFVRTCGRTMVDTRLAVYRGCLCPPTDANLAACEDDQCGLQSMARFEAVQGESYLIRVGTYPERAAGSGRFDISCGPPDHPACPGSGSCCAEQSAGACCDENCCETVCACDPYCCTTEWDAGCATVGFQGRGCGAGVLCEYCQSGCGDPCASSCCTANTTPGCSDPQCCERVCECDPFCCGEDGGTWDANCAGNGFIPGCGAAALCADLCGSGCPAGAITWIEPPSGTLDARRPHHPQNAAAAQGIQTLRVAAPTGADDVACWKLCEGLPGSTLNSITSVVSNGDGTVTLQLTKPLTPGKVTKIAYTNSQGSSTVGEWIAHPANVNGDGFANSTDVGALEAALRGAGGLPAGVYRRDINHSGAFTAADLLEAADVLNGASQFTVWNGTPKPSPPAQCP